jgi:hypothetical protein
MTVILLDENEKSLTQMTSLPDENNKKIIIER